MDISSRSGIIILFATVAVCTLVLFPLLQFVAERDPQLSAYDDDWNDISNFREGLENNPSITSFDSSVFQLVDITFARSTTAEASALAEYQKKKREIALEKHKKERLHGLEKKKK